MRCAMGQTWTGGTCSGTANTYNWAQAVALTGATSFAGQSDWRLPNIRELQSIVDLTTSNPAINTGVFPNTPSDWFWSSSSYATNPHRAWNVYFYGGYTSVNSQSYYYPVRLVRSGQSLGLLNPARPSTDYVDQANGTAAHTPSGLIWKRCAEGQTWSGSTCTGTGSTYTWDAARALSSTFAGNSGWRLPSEEELLSLVDYTIISPSINATLFPLNASDYFWSASSSAIDPANAWVISFGDGGTATDYQGNRHPVLLVRSGQSLGTFALTLSGTSSGSGAITSSLGSLNCNSTAGTTTGTCSANLFSGTAVTLTATPVSGNTFSAWSGACSGTSTTCTLTMDAAKNVTASFDRTLVSQSITYGTVPTVIVGGTGIVSATGGGSGLPVTFTSLTTSICTVSGSNGNTVLGVATGTCSIAANQAGNSSYSAAPQVTQNIGISPASTYALSVNASGQRVS
jgi:hypothetical protein